MNFWNFVVPRAPDRVTMRTQLQAVAQLTSRKVFVLVGIGQYSGVVILVSILIFQKAQLDVATIANVFGHIYLEAFV